MHDERIAAESSRLLTDKIPIAFFIICWGSCEKASLFIIEAHAIEVEHELVGTADAVDDLGVGPHCCDFMFLQGLGFIVHSLLRDREAVPKVAGPEGERELFDFPTHEP